MTTPRELPITFSPAMVRAVRRADSPKTQTRRAIVPQPHAGVRWGPQGWEDGHGRPIRATYQVGDRLWVREGLRRTELNELVVYQNDNAAAIDPDTGTWAGWRWQRPTLPARFMPKAYARQWLEVIDVRAEIVSEISPEDCLAEGITIDLETHAGQYWREEAVIAFATLWDSLNARRGYGWATCPWVFAYTFRDITHEVRSPSAVLAQLRDRFGRYFDGIDVEQFMREMRED